MNTQIPHPNAANVTQLLLDWSNGEPAALEQLIPLVYNELRRLARLQMRKERAGHTLQTTAVVNEVYLRLIDSSRVRWQSRAHFYAVAAQLMRRVLVDHARSRNAQKCGGNAIRVELDEALCVGEDHLTEALAIDEALVKLSHEHPTVARIVEMRFFAGLEGREIGLALGLTPGRVSQLWKFAQAWLKRELSAKGDR